MTAEAASTREMVDALRAMLGLDPLYALDERAQAKRWAESREKRHLEMAR